MGEYVTQAGALPDARREALWSALGGSRFVARNPLVGMFQGSRGFSFIFTTAGRPTLLERFGFLEDYLALVGRPELWPRPRWPWRGRRTPNAFYLNLLLLGPGQAVGAHIDVSLREPSGDRRTAPEHVSVLYLSVPPALQGGALVLSRKGRTVGEVLPSPGLLVHFRGDLTHEVRPFHLGTGDASDSGDATDTWRASLVCEQYALSPRLLERIPAFSVRSKAGFGAYLEEHRDRGA